jgi:hypothetical protein
VDNQVVAEAVIANVATAATVAVVVAVKIRDQQAVARAKGMSVATLKHAIMASSKRALGIVVLISEL